MCNCFYNSTNFLNYSSIFSLENLYENQIGSLYSGWSTYGFSYSSITISIVGWINSLFSASLFLQTFSNSFLLCHVIMFNCPFGLGLGCPRNLLAGINDDVCCCVIDATFRSYEGNSMRLSTTGDNFNHAHSKIVSNDVIRSEPHNSLWPLLRILGSHRRSTHMQVWWEPLIQ